MSKEKDCKKLELLEREIEHNTYFRVLGKRAIFDESATTRHYKDLIGYNIEIESWSPCGENLIESFDIPKDFSGKDVYDGINECICDRFDVDDHVSLWVDSRGKGGCPSSISELVEDAENIEQMYEDLRDHFKNFVFNV